MEVFATFNLKATLNGLWLILLFVAVLGTSIVCAKRRKTYLRTCHLTWMSMLAWGIPLCLVVPFAIHTITGYDDIWEYFPNPMTVVVLVAIGWLYAAILTVIVKSIFEFVYSRRDKAAAAAPPSDT